MPEAMRMWTVYNRPKDYPDKFVARLWVIESGNPEPIATTTVHTADTLDALRAMIPPGLYCQPRQPGDDAKIVECWF